MAGLKNERVKTAVLVSGRGSNLQSLIDACADKNFPAEINIVISNKADVYALERAKLAGLPTLVIDHKNFATREEFESALHDELIKAGTELVCLAGFMRVLTASFVTKWAEHILNIHPSLLPKYKGLHTHERALETGDKESGCTIHFVTPELDDGEIIVQKAVPILAGDTAEILAARVLEAEHVAYPEGLRLIASKILKSHSTGSMIRT